MAKQKKTIFKSTLEDKINLIYKNEFEKFGMNRCSLMWTKDKQFQRFSLLLDSSLQKSKKSILDFGCGFGDLKLHLDRNFFNTTYIGCDINKEFIKEARKAHPDSDFYAISSFKDIKKSYDIIIVSGSLNTLPSLGQSQKEKYMFSTISYLFSKTNYMLAFNLLSSNTDQKYRNKNSLYIKPEKVMKFIRDNLSQRITLDHGTLPFEFTVKVFKDIEINKLNTTFIN